MKTVNSLSGGKTSSFIAAHHPADYEVFSLVCLDDPACGLELRKDPGMMQYINAKLDQYGYIQQYGEFVATAEDDKTLYAMRDLEQYLGREIIWVRGKSFDQVIDEPSYFGGKSTRLPSWARRYCTLEMKLLPIFLWWHQWLGPERVKMRIGFRMDEYDRMESFMNNGENRGGFKIPVACSLKGKRRQIWETFDWRYCTFPLIRDAVIKGMVDDYWKFNGYIGGTDLYDGPRRQIEFPEISNCVFCFHKKPHTLAIMAATQTPKMLWAARQEGKGMGTWLDSQTAYAAIIKHALATPYTIEMLQEHGAACDSGGCTD